MKPNKVIKISGNKRMQENFKKTILDGIYINNDRKYFWNDRPGGCNVEKGNILLFLDIINNKGVLTRVKEKGSDERIYQILKKAWKDESESYRNYIELKILKIFENNQIKDVAKKIFKGQTVCRNFNDLEEEIQDIITRWISESEKNTKVKIEYNANKINCLSKKLNLDQHIIKSFYNSLKTKGFVILAGLSGTGKTKIFEEFVKCFPKVEKEFISIRPDFKDTKSLLGFYNPLKETYHSTPLLEFILRASKNYSEKGKEADPFFILFDEMNLARVEYYFADFLSILETKRFEDKEDALKNHKFKEFIKTLGINSLKEDNFRFTSQSIKLHSENLNDVPQELFLPPNLYFAGTVNIDETTYMFSPKVLDRSFTIEFDVGDFFEYLKFLKEDNTENNKTNMTEDFKTQLKKDFINEGKFTLIDKEKIKEFADKPQNFVEKLEKINSILKPYNLHFGYRVFDEITMFLYNSQNSLLKFENLNEAFDLAIKMKILPKFNGTRQRLWDPIVKLLKEISIEKPENLIENGVPDLKSISNQKYKHTAHKLLEMLYKLKTQGFASFI
ncbi:McrB family protein [Desulfurobacterium sp.]